MYEQLDEPIKVGAVFQKTHVIPCWFVRQGQRHEIKEIAFTWQDRQGNARLLYFSVSDGRDVYQISFNTETFSWKLDKVFVE